MSSDRLFDDVKEQVRKIVPSAVNITNIDFEGPLVVIYTKDLEAFSNNNDLVRQLAQGLRKRVAIRPDPASLANPEQVEKKLREIIPEEAEIVDIYFEEDDGEVFIEAKNPGLVIGKGGAVLNEIKKEIGWSPKVVRAPPIRSKNVSEIRLYLRVVQEERKEFLRKVARKMMRPKYEGENWIRMTTLGGYREVGRSATLLSTRDSKILIDCGMMPGDSSHPGPFFEAPEVQPLENIDAVVITHAHQDHYGLLPALYKYGYDGPVYCTPPTRDLMVPMLIDSIKVGAGENRKPLFSSKEIKEVVKHCIPLKYNETTDISPDMRLTFQNAGHILGSSISHFHIGDGLYNIAFTGDMKFERTWLFNAATNKFPRLETLVIEATYGGYHDLQPSRIEASSQLKDVLERVIQRQGKLVVPVFAVGRCQEVMLVIEELVRTGKIPEIPVFVDGLAWEATAIHTAYPEYLNSQLRTQIFQMGQNPFLSKIFHPIKGMEEVQTADHDKDAYVPREYVLNYEGSCVVLSTSGMLQGGPIMEFIKHWGDNPNHTLAFVGYQAEHTMGRRIQKGLSEIPMSEKGKPFTVSMKMNIETVDGFSGHSDRRQLVNYISSLEPKPERVVICHGEEHKCTDLASALHKKFNIETRAPMNLETIRMR